MLKAFVKVMESVDELAARLGELVDGSIAWMEKTLRRTIVLLLFFTAMTYFLLVSYVNTTIDHFQNSEQSCALLMIGWVFVLVVLGKLFCGWKKIFQIFFQWLRVFLGIDRSTDEDEDD